MKTRGQLTLEFLVLTAGLLGIYSLSLPFFLSSFQKASAELNEQAVTAVIEHIKWKSREASALAQGSTLIGSVFSPIDLKLTFYNGEIIYLNSSVSAAGIIDGQIELKKGRTALQFFKTTEGVEVQLK